jgi:NAD(P)-dependent dehydrogenase (short-subunit alcohol dehydrogenase family)
MGHRVALLARREDRIAGIAAEINAAAGQEQAIAVQHDVRETEEVERLWGAIESRLGEVDSMYFVAGILEDVGAQEFDTAKDARHFAINTIGCVAWVNAAARRFGPRGSGTIVGISSVAQDRGRTGRPAYNASKAGMDTHLEAVRNRLWRRGVTVTTARPGFVETDMIKGAKKLFWLISPDRAAEIIIRAATRRRSIVYVPARWRLLMFVIRSIPSFIFRRLDV